MRLRDDAFQAPVRDPWPPRYTRATLEAALAGIGDPNERFAQDFLWSMGLDRQAAFQVGDEVEFEIPHAEAGGLRRAGRIHEMNARDAIVQVGAGEFAIVPMPQLRPLNREAQREAKRESVRRAIRGGGGVGTLSETRTLSPISSTEMAMTLQYSAGRPPSEDDVRTFVASRYPDARVLDGDDTYPGRLGLVLGFGTAEAASAARARSAQLVSPKDAPSSRQNATGIGAPEMPGTGAMGEGIHADVELDAASPRPPKEWLGDPRFHQDWQRRQYPQEPAPPPKPRHPEQTFDLEPGPGLDLAEPTPAGPGTHNSAGDDQPLDTGAGGTGMGMAMTGQVLERLAALNPAFDFVEGAIEETHEGAVSQFSIQRAGRVLFVKDGALTPVLSHGAYPAHGFIEAAVVGDGLRVLTGAWLHSPNGPEFLRAAGLRQTAMDAYQQMGGPIPSHENEPGANETGSYVIKADGGVQSPVATEEDGESRETIGGPGLHVAVDGPTQNYWQGYYGDYGAQLTNDVPTREAEARVAMVRTAWHEGSGREASAEDLLWALGVLDGFGRLAQTQPATATPPGTGSTTTEIANALISAMHMDPRVKERLQPILTKEIAKFPEGMRRQFQNLNDPRVLQQILPRALDSMNPQKREELIYEYAPQFGGQQPGKAKRLWRSLPGGGAGVGKTRQQMEYAQQFLKDQGQPMPGTQPQPQPQPAPQSQPAPQPAGQPASQPASQPAGQGQQQPAGQPAGQGGQPAPKKNKTLPAGTQVSTPQGNFVLKMPTPVRRAQPNGGAQPAGQPQFEPERPGEEWDRGMAFSGERTAFSPSADGEDYSRTYAQGTPADAYAGNRQPATNELRMRMTDLVRRGDYLIMAVVWDPESTKKMSAGNVAQSLKSFVKQRSGSKEFIDLGHIGKPVIESMDLDAGIAEVRFRSSESRIAPPEYVKKEDASYHEPVR